MLAFHLYYVKCVLVCSFSSMLMCLVMIKLVVGPFGRMVIYSVRMLWYNKSELYIYSGSEIDKIVIAFTFMVMGRIEKICMENCVIT